MAAAGTATDENSAEARRLVPAWYAVVGGCVFAGVGPAVPAVLLPHVPKLVTCAVAAFCLVGLIVSVLPMSRVEGAAVWLAVSVYASPLGACVSGMMAYEGYLLERDGRTVQVQVVDTYTVRGRNGPAEFLELADLHGRRLPGANSSMSDREVRAERGDVLTIVADPRGRVGPRLPGHVDVAPSAVAFCALSLLSVVSVLGLATVTRRTALSGRLTELGHPKAPAQEAALRKLLRTGERDEHGYLTVHPDTFDSLSQARAARIAREENLRAEAFGNAGRWRFAESVVEEVAPE